MATHLETFGAARHGGEYVITVHGAENEAGTVPYSSATSTTNRSSAAAFQTAHAHR